MTGGLAHREAGGFARIPRVVTLALAYAIARHLWAAAVAIGHPAVIGAPDWVALAVAETLLLSVALRQPWMFMVRTLRLTGVGVAANALIILAPLPDVISVFDRFVPPMMVYSLAAGVASMAAVFLLMERWASPTGHGCTRTVGLTADHDREWMVPAAIVVVTLLVLPVWLIKGGTPPLLSLIGGTRSLDLAANRQAALSNLDSAPLKFTIAVLRNLLLMFAAGWFVATAASAPREMWRRRGTAETTALAVVALGVLFALWTTERAVVGELLAVCALSVIVVNRREISTRLIGILVIVAGTFPFAVGFMSGAGNAVEVLVGLRRRAFYLPAEVMTRYFIEFPAHHEYLMGTSIPKLSYLTGGESFNLSTYIYQRYYQRGLGYVGNANGSFFGTGWANFGPIGVVLWAVAAAAMLVILDRALDRLPRRSAAALRGLGVIMAVLTTSSDIFRNILGFLPGYLDLLVVVAVMARLSRRRSYRLESRTCIPLDGAQRIGGYGPATTTPLPSTAAGHLRLSQAD